MKRYREITMRRGREQFRNNLFAQYGRRCLVTGCNIVDILEAAHIDPYRHESHNHPGNGLLLRADIHTLFDLNLLGIEPTSLEIELHPLIASDYMSVVNKRLGCEGSRRPLHEVLSRRYESFKYSRRWKA